MPTLQERDRAILYHVCRFRLSINYVLEELFFKNVRSRHPIIQRLRKQGHLAVHEKAFGSNRGMSYYFPTEAFIAAAGLPESRAKPLNEQDLNVSLAVLGFCCLAGKDRLRVEPSEVAELLGIKAAPMLFDDADDAAPSASAFVVERADADTALYEVYVPSGARTVPQIAEHLEGRIAKARANDHVHAWLRERRYGFAVLVDQERKCVELKRRLEVESVPRRVRLAIETAPSSATIERFLRQHGINRAKSEGST